MFINVIYNIRNRVSLDLLATDGRISLSDPGKQQLEIIITLCGGSYRAAWIARIHLLLYGNSGGNAADIIHFWFFHAAQELARVGAQTFHVHPLAFCKKGIKSQ